MGARQAVAQLRRYILGPSQLRSHQGGSSSTIRLTGCVGSLRHKALSMPATRRALGKRLKALSIRERRACALLRISHDESLPANHVDEGSDARRAVGTQGNGCLPLESEPDSASRWINSQQGLQPPCR